MNKDVIAYIDELEGNVEKYVENYLNSMEELGMDGETTLRAIKVTRQICDVVEEKLKSQKTES